MADDHWIVLIKGVTDGAVARLGRGHAWTWERADGTKETFDCGLAISHVLDCIAVRLDITPRDVHARH